MVCAIKKKMKKKLTWRIWLLIILLVLSLLSIFGMPPTFLKKGVLITSIETNSSLFEQGMRQNQIISSINGIKINSLSDYNNYVQLNFPTQENVKVIFDTNQGQYIIFTKDLSDLSVKEIPNTNLKTGLDISGGARALVKAQNLSLTSSELNDLVDITSNRLNTFGLTDLKVLPISDLSGNHFMLIEIAGATQKDIKSLISEQGKFEAKIGNDTVFEGGNKDIASVGRDAQNARIEGCDQVSDQSYTCRFSFSVTLSGDAAKRQAELTENLSVNISSQGNYLSQPLDLYLDDKLVDSLSISEDLKGRVTTQISISGSGVGATQEEAYENAKDNMKKLQTILLTGSLPYKLEIVKLDTISPTLGKEFVKYILLAGIAALLVVALIIFIRYKKLKISLVLLLTTFSEVIIILGIASLIEWNIDLPGVAGILATLGTGIDDLVVILDESTHSVQTSLKQRLKRAFAIIMGAYFTALVSLLPLLWAGAGLLKGFAITTIIGISVGVLITRPAFSDFIKRFQE